MAHRYDIREDNDGWTDFDSSRVSSWCLPVAA